MLHSSVSLWNVSGKKQDGEDTAVSSDLVKAQVHKSVCGSRPIINSCNPIQHSFIQKMTDYQQIIGIISATVYVVTNR